MHIAEGVLHPAILVVGAVLTTVGTAYGLKSLRTEHLLISGVLAAFFFVASLVHVPIGVSSAHLLCCGLLGIVLGYGTFPTILVALFLQAILFQYGGLTILGVNTFTMATSGVLSWYLFRFLRLYFQSPRNLPWIAFVCGSLSVVWAALLTSMALYFSEEGFFVVAMTLLGSHVPIMVAEGVITMFLIIYIQRVRPDLLPSNGEIRVCKS
ncbi:MAG: cobalt transporter CbiM [Desulfovibrio sp.]|nr:cobalt transporter CbiM [Desulfovibrio sp.]